MAIGFIWNYEYVSYIKPGVFSMFFDKSAHTINYNRFLNKKRFFIYK